MIINVPEENDIKIPLFVAPYYSGKLANMKEMKRINYVIAIFVFNVEELFLAKKKRFLDS